MAGSFFSQHWPAAWHLGGGLRLGIWVPPASTGLLPFVPPSEASLSSHLSLQINNLKFHCFVRRRDSSVVHGSSEKFVFREGVQQECRSTTPASFARSAGRKNVVPPFAGRAK
ncbi:hypothetical protein U9M48_000905 [Paspalum notatum var. saurae]|uniref:Uncharacterized protein n=1 Tax=Paspalum notatum var. saurae TaxID=547442 RepID=A0AAQ3PFB2_PASNO